MTVLTTGPTQGYICEDSTWITSSVLSELANMTGIPLQVYRAKNRWVATSDKQLCGKLMCGHTILYMRKVSSGHSPSIETVYSIKGFCLWTLKAQTRLRSKISFLCPDFPSKHTTSLQRRCNVTTLQRLCYDVVYLLGKFVCYCLPIHQTILIPKRCRPL